MTRRPIIIDTDPGIDDAVAIAIALNSEELDVKLISTVAGNVDVEKTTRNALKLVTFLGKETPVAKGADRPLLKELETASDVHGESGMDGYEFPESQNKELSIHAVEALKKYILASPEKITLVPIAALTNIALLFTMYPEVKENIEEIVMMGGTLSRGNTNSIAEFNTYVDPHAAQMVFQAGVPITMVGLDVTDTAVLTSVENEQIKTYGKVGEMFYALFQHYRGGSLKSGLKMHDVCAIAYLLQPEMFKTQLTHAEIQLEGPAAGAVITDLKMNYHTTTNVSVCLEIDVEKFRHWTLKELQKNQ